MRETKDEAERRGLFIAVEGIDGAGKTTQAYLLVEGLKRRGCRAVYTVEPTYGRVGTIIRLHTLRMQPRYPLLEALLFAADRLEHVKRGIGPRVRRGVTAVSDRYLYSSLAYQFAAGVDLQWLRTVNRFAPKPDIIFYLDIDPQTALGRKQEDHYAFGDIEYQRRVREAYLKLAEEEGFITLDGGEPKEKIRRKMLNITWRYLKARR